MILDLAAWYLYAGLALAVPFLSWGIDRVEPNARGAYVFRPLLVPGIALIWPLVAWRWWRLERDPARAVSGARHRPPLRAQAALMLALAIALPSILLAAALVRQDGGPERPAVRLEAPQ